MTRRDYKVIVAILKKVKQLLSPEDFDSVTGVVMAGLKGDNANFSEDMFMEALG